MGTIDSFTWTTITDGRIDPNSPLDTTLTTDLRDNLENLMRWIGKDFLGGQVANHDHDDTNSKKILASNIDGLTDLSEWTWEDDGDNIFSDSASTTGTVSISGAVPVGTYIIFCWLNVTLSDSGTDTLSIREVGVGTYREVFESDLGGNTILSTGNVMIPVDSNRVIDRKTIEGGTGFLFEAYLRLYQTT